MKAPPERQYFSDFAQAIALRRKSFDYRGRPPPDDFTFFSHLHVSERLRCGGSLSLLARGKAGVLRQGDCA
jgi:hypothetical protein